jgi:hypothetical protein
MTRPVESYPARLLRLSAEFGARGFALHPLDGEKLIVTKWNMTRVLADLDDAERMLAQIGPAT